VLQLAKISYVLQFCTSQCWNDKSDLTMTTYLFMIPSQNATSPGQFVSIAVPHTLPPEVMKAICLPLCVRRASRNHLHSTPPSKYLRTNETAIGIPPNARQKKLHLHASCELKPCRSAIYHIGAKASPYSLQLRQVSITIADSYRRTKETDNYSDSHVTQPTKSRRW
jgi:hypothetical protein